MLQISNSYILKEFLLQSRSTIVFYRNKDTCNGLLMIFTIFFKVYLLIQHIIESHYFINKFKKFLYTINV
jgi:hypothetical protein